MTSTIRTTLTPPPPSAASSRGDGARPGLLYAGLLLAMAPLLARAVSNATALPGWDADPLLTPVTSGAMGPAGSVLCDAVSLVGSAVLLAREGRCGRPLSRVLTGLTLAGVAGVLGHAAALAWWPAGGGSIEGARIGAAWLSAMAAALALAHAGREGAARRVALGVLLGFVAVLAVRGLEQVLVEHPATVRQFEREKAQILAARGWTPGSPSALAFERRLTQAEATGWFGLANVYATFAAGFACAGAAMVVAAARGRRERGTGGGRWPLAASAAAAGLGGLALALAWSKGGFIAAGAGFAGLGAVWAISRKGAAGPAPRWMRGLAGAVGLGAIAGPIALVALRGALGERMGERSLLFRWFYDVASARIIARNPLAGVGPDGYQAAFLLAKPPLCPEEVSSPHCVPLDWLATLGVVAGGAWTAALLLCAWRAGTGAAVGGRGDAPAEPGALDRGAVRVLLLTPAVATLCGMYVDTPGILPESAAARLVGAGLWAAIGVGVARVSPEGRWARLALGAGALAVIAHAQIDVAGSLPASCGVWACVVGLAASMGAAAGRDGRGARAAMGVLASAIVAAAAVAVAVGAALPGWRWERLLKASADSLRPIPDLSARLAAAREPAELGPIAAEASVLLGRTVAPEPGAVGAALIEYERRAIPAAAESLRAAHAVNPTGRAPLREASRILIRLADDLRSVGATAEAAAAADRAVEVLGLDPGSPAQPAGVRSTDWAWLATLLEHRAAAHRRPGDLPLAVQARLRVEALDPYNLPNVVRLARLLGGLGSAAESRLWARRALELDRFTRLDAEVKSLNPGDRAEMERLAAGAGSGGGAEGAGRP